jgi:hypothetical protein
MTPNVKHSASLQLHNNHHPISMVDHASQFSIMSHYSQGSYPNQKVKRPRANSYDPFRNGILDKEEEEPEEEENQFQQLNMNNNQ